MMHLEISLTVVAAILTVIGYSLNDTIIIFDRVRENLKKQRKESLRDVLNRSINETLPRSILTHATVLAATLSLLFFAGEVIRPFSWIMAFGVFTGTFSSIYVAGADPPLDRAEVAAQHRRPRTRERRERSPKGGAANSADAGRHALTLELLTNRRARAAVRASMTDVHRQSRSPRRPGVRRGSRRGRSNARAPPVRARSSASASRSPPPSAPRRSPRRHPGFVFFTAGVHPHDAAEFDPARDPDAIRELVARGAVAIGECGLDYHYDHSPRDLQRRAFAAQLALARELDRPVVVHTREAEDDTRAMVVEAGPAGVRGVLHCYTGSHALAEAALAVGWYVSFSGIVTFKKWDGRRADSARARRSHARRIGLAVSRAGAAIAESATSRRGLALTVARVAAARGDDRGDADRCSLRACHRRCAQRLSSRSSHVDSRSRASPPILASARSES